MGHSSTRATLIYQHIAMERDRAIADALGKLAEKRNGHRRSKSALETIKARSGISL
ncbi:hypothetical protein SAMN05421869_106126 [Nonomuraea jiangxiensis]|uniref:Phage integrase family protein n=1 Tax=Nonomuraea jiangxiensis TaxID=633440 RepID=A0A1G8LLN1_9ACTN|nr:hypothetical protein SAMN05421869_106126 [Nonomuraea jiangxiensis]